jgi:prepilin signal peptidase PulO-like enzyme (type II secretory pathway)
MIVGLIGSFLFGSIIGSFLNVLILRLPEEETMSGRSHCMHCKHELGFLDLFPIFSYVFLGGKCRYCKKPISRRYIYIEIITGFLVALCFARIFPHSSEEYLLMIRDAFICCLMLVVFVIDYEHFLILDKIVIWGALVIFVLNVVIDIWHKTYWTNSLAFNGLLSATGLMIFFGAIYYLSRGKWMGFGDVKFALVLGLAAPFPSIIVSVFLSFTVGSIVGILLLIFRTKHLNSEVPFGTFLAFAAVVTMFYGETLLNWYLRTTGLWLYV